MSQASLTALLGPGAADRVADPKSIDRAGRGLAPIRSAVWMDVVFVNVSGDAPPLESAVAPLAALSAPYDMERFRLAHYQAGDVPANWKLTIEAAVENYHEEFVHQQLPARVDATSARTFSDVFEGEVWLSGRRRPHAVALLGRRDPAFPSQGRRCHDGGRPVNGGIGLCGSR